ncbi:acetylxylan esterase [Terriglobus albidus]|uniref:Acetylxylan esterase n=1 Tax=Terriglobus albidus TaxID=1592106 RepID=A0A5B9EAA2_9BACT|nr:acetylxylan esterase [Terriglobus albidus]QEE28594.1 acetylxylan esterase [Terriglobus albidus]
MTRSIVLSACLLVCSLPGINGQAPGSTSAEPKPLTFADGTPVKSPADFSRRREELLNLFAQNVYGQISTATIPMRIAEVTTETAFEGLAIRRQLVIEVGSTVRRTWHLLLYLPVRSSGPVPVIVGLNFEGNQTVSRDKGVRLTPIWTPVQTDGPPLAKELSPHRLASPGEATRGSAADQWQLEQILHHGYGLATMYAGDVEPDFIGGIAYGARSLLFGNGQRLPNRNSPGAIAVWAWSMSRIIDILSEDPSIDRSRFVAFGFSRFGKTALWAVAQDQRFAAVLSNESGQAGATLSRRKVGESTDHLMLAFPYWFCPNYQRYLGHIEELPVDGHLLLSLISPRLLYVGSAIDDPFSDPKGEFLSVLAVSPVYELLGRKGLPPQDMPPTGTTIGMYDVRYHVRDGGHDVTAFDWSHYLQFLDERLKASAHGTKP